MGLRRMLLALGVIALSVLLGGSSMALCRRVMGFRQPWYDFVGAWIFLLGAPNRAPLQLIPNHENGPSQNLTSRNYDGQDICNLGRHSAPRSRENVTPAVSET